MGDSSAGANVPTIEELRGLESTYRHLLKVEIPGWYAGRAGRYHAYDTERKNALRSRILLDLRYGKMPTPLTQEVMTFGKASSLSSSERKKMDEWVALEKAMADTTQKLISVAFESGRHLGAAPQAPRGRPKEYRLDIGTTYQGMTLWEISRVSTSSHFGPQYITEFLGGEDYDQRFPRDLQLFAGLHKMESGGATWVRERNGRRYTLSLPSAA